jgi:hypothetical protein
MKKKEENPDGLVEVILIAHHNHAGKSFKPGESLKVNQVMKKWLIEQGVVAPEPEII